MAVILVDSEGRVLLQERDEHPAIDPEKWGFVGGHVDDGESVEEAAYRELAEETGVTMPPGSLARWQEYAVFHPAYATTDRMTVYAAATSLADADIVLGEGRQIVFVDPDEALRRDLSDSASTALPEFVASDLYRRLRHG